MERGPSVTRLRNVKEAGTAAVGSKRKRLEEVGRQDEEPVASLSSRPEKRARKVTVIAEDPLDDDPPSDARERRLSEKGHAQKVDQLSKELSRLLSEVQKLNRGRL